MLNERIPRALGENISLRGIVYRLNTAALRGDMVVYSAAAAKTSTWEDVLIRELFPRSGMVSRLGDGSLYVSPAGTDIIQRAWDVAARGQQAENLWLQPCGGHSDLIDAYGTCYVVRSFPKAVPLHAMLSQGPVPLEMALFLMDQLLSVVEAIHHAGLLHLYITPQTIYLLSGGQLILDYDCLFDKQRPEDSSGAGSLTSYSAPEMRLCNFLEIYEAADLYSCCTVFFEMIFGRPLSEADILGQQLPRMLRYTLSERLPQAPELLSGLTSLLCRGLHTLPHRRFQSAAEFRQALHTISHQKALMPPPAEPCMPSAVPFAQNKTFANSPFDKRC